MGWAAAALSPLAGLRRRVSGLRPPALEGFNCNAPINALGGRFTSILSQIEPGLHEAAVQGPSKLQSCDPK